MTLYREFRPQTFDSVVGQEHIIKTITNQIKSNRIAHAYLFSGPRGIGKTTTARLVAKAINCKNKNNFEPCNECESCQSITLGNAIDVIEIDAASHTGVDIVREVIIENAQFRPTLSPFKIFILDESHMLSTSAFNALLKILEEPPSYVIFIFATTEQRKLPATILSRCQRFQFKKIPNELVKKELNEIAHKLKFSIDDDVLVKIAQKSGGHLRDAVTMLEQLTSSGEKKINKELAEIFLPTTNEDGIITLLQFIVDKDTTNALTTLNSLAEQTPASQIADDLTQILRISLLLRSKPDWTSEDIDLNEKTREKIKEINNKINDRELIRLLDILFKRKKDIAESSISQLPLEIMIIEACLYEVAQTTFTPPRAQAPILETKSEQPMPEIPPSNPTIVEEKKLEEPKKPIKETFTKLIKKEKTNLTFVEITEKWPIFVMKIEEKFPSLVFILKMANILELEGSCLKISVPFSFHKEKLLDKRYLPNISEILNETFGAKINLDVEIRQETEPIIMPQNTKEIEDIANLMGGEVV